MMSLKYEETCNKPITVQWGTCEGCIGVVYMRWLCIVELIFFLWKEKYFLFLWGILESKSEKISWCIQKNFLKAISDFWDYKDILGLIVPIFINIPLLFIIYFIPGYQ